MDVVIYARWSSAEQSRGSSRARQLDLCRAHAATNGWTITQELIDDGLSAFSGRHAKVGKLGEFVADVERGMYPAGIVLLAEKLDRLSRQNAKSVFSWMLRMTEAGVTIATVDGDRRYDSSNLDMASIIEIVVKAQLANEESQKKADRLTSAWSKKRDRLSGPNPQLMTRRAPAWLEVIGDPPRFSVVEDRAVIIRRIFEYTVAGFGKHAIARRLNQDGVPTFGRATGWHASYIQKILNSPAVLGEMQFGQKPRSGPRTPVGDPIVGYYPAVIDADLHARARQSIAGRSRRVAGRGRRLVNIFSGIATCGECGQRMTFRSKGEKTRANGERVNEDYLVCDSYQRGRGCLNKQHFNYPLWETAVLNAVLTQAIGDEHFASQQEVYALEIEQAELTRFRDTSRRKADTAMDLYLETQRQEAKLAWTSLTADVDQAEAALALMRKRIETARGTVSPAEHQKRIADLFSRMTDPDEDRRFEARARVMEAVHAILHQMRFTSSPPAVEVIRQSGSGCRMEWVGGVQLGLEFSYQYDDDFFRVGL